jgi:hypothetical protein
MFAPPRGVLIVDNAWGQSLCHAPGEQAPPVIPPKHFFDRSSITVRRKGYRFSRAGESMDATK